MTLPERGPDRFWVVAVALTIEIDGDTLTQKDADGVFNETWERVKAQ